MLRGGENRGDADADAFAPAADACACFVETTIRRAAPGDVDADLLLAVAARLLRGDASNARRAPRLVSLAAAILTRPSSAAAAALAPALEITAGRWAVEGGDARGGGGGGVGETRRTRVPSPTPPPSRPNIARLSPPCTSPRFGFVGPRVRRRCATRRRRPGRARRFWRRRRGRRSNARGVLTGTIPANPEAFRGVVVEVLDANARGFSARISRAARLRDAFATAAIGGARREATRRRRRGLRRLTHALASADWDAFFDRVAPAAAAEARNLTNEQRAAILALVPRSCADEPSLGRALERFARDAKLYARVNRTALE